MKDKTSSFDSLLKVLPVLAASYPGIASLLAQLTGDTSGNTGQIQDAMGKVTKKLAEMDQETKEELVKQLFSFFPELEELVK